MSAAWDETAADERATAEIGRRFADRLTAGDVVALIGPLGAGKTTFTRAVVAGLGGDPSAVSSPTFALVHEYAARWPVYHFDAYRLPDASAFAGLGLGEYFSAGGVCLIEWADRFPELLPEQRWQVRTEPLGETRRRFRFTRFGPPAARPAAGRPRT